MQTDELVTVVARAILMAHCEDTNPPGTDNQEKVDNKWPDWTPEAQAAIAVIVEECAKVADEFHRRSIQWAKKVRGLEKYIDETDSSRIATAIRAMRGEG